MVVNVYNDHCVDNLHNAFQDINLPVEGFVMSDIELYFKDALLTRFKSEFRFLFAHPSITDVDH